jgi:hypothetical protein
VDEVRGQRPHRGEIEVLHDAELLKEHPAHGVRRRLADGVPAVRELDRRLHLGDERAEVVRAHQATGRLARGREPPRDLTAIEVIGAGGGQALERAREVGLHDRRAEPGGPPVAEEYLGASGVSAQGGDLLAGEVPAGAGHTEAVPGVVDRRLEQ